MDKIWAKDVKEGEKVKSTFVVARKAVPTAKSGKTYLAVTLHDKTGELEARSFDKVEELGTLFEEKDFVEVEGLVGTFQGRPQLRIETVAKVDPAGLDASEFVFVPPPEVVKKPERSGAAEAEESLWAELTGLVEAIADEHVKDLVKSFLLDEDVVARLRRAPAAKTVHHAYPGGLLEHTVACLKLAHRLADQYPQVDRDLLVAGAFLHDIGKVRELAYGGQTEYTDEGRLVGHLVMTAQWIHDKARRVGVPKDLEHHIVHIVLSHHGKLEYGSPKVPMTLEAMLVHYLDEIDSRVNSWLNLMGREAGSKRWTDTNHVYEQHIWRGTLPTVQAEKRGPAPELMGPVIYVPRGDHGGNRSGQGGNAGKKKPPRPPREPREPRPEQAPRQVEGAPAEGAAAPSGEAPAERPPRPPRPERHDRGPRGPGGPGGAGGPGGERGDRKPRYMGPRLPGDRGPQFRPEKKKDLTHNPFAALAQKLEGGQPEGAASAEAPPPEPNRAAEPTPPEAQATPPEAQATAPEPQEGADTGSGQG